MTTSLHHSSELLGEDRHIHVEVTPALEHRNRLSCAFRPILAIPHVLLVGAPTGFGLMFGWKFLEGPNVDLGAGTGVLGLVAGVAALIAWFSILFTGTYPNGLWQLAAFYLRWRVRAMTYTALLRDEYPPFGDDEYPAHVDLTAPAEPRNRITTAFRIFMLVPHFMLLWLLSIFWLPASIAAWMSILLTGRYPESLYRFAIGMVRWSVRVEAYLLLLHDDYPPFALE